MDHRHFIVQQIVPKQWGSKMHSNRGYEMVVRPKGRTPATMYLYKGKCWIEGRENSNYFIELKNNTGNRVMAVVSVDGLSVTNGQLASFDSDGFLVEPYGTVSLPGWMLNNQTAAEFVFGKKENSYATQIGESGNTGVIGAAWFTEKPKPIKYVKGIRGITASSGVGMMSSNSIVASGYTQSLGTEFGESVGFATTQVAFEKASNTPETVMLIYYDTAQNLQKMGIRLKERYTYSIPDAFPASKSDFCKPPPSWVSKNR
jgi:hypothetical protein